MNAIEQYATLNTSLMRRFKAVRGVCPIEEIAKAMGISHITIYSWLAQERITRLHVLARIDAWVEAQETTQPPITRT